MPNLPTRNLYSLNPCLMEIVNRVVSAIVRTKIELFPMPNLPTRNLYSLNPCLMEIVNRVVSAIVRTKIELFPTVYTCLVTVTQSMLD